MPKQTTTDNEIVKGLEVCQNISGETCDDCPYEESKHLDEVMPNGLNYDQMSCDMWLQMDSLDLINRQKAEIERLNKFALIRNLDRCEAEIKSEAYREFAEVLKKKLYIADNNWHPVVCEEEIDEALKELVGDDE